MKLTDAQALLFWQQYDYWLNVEGSTEENSQQFSWFTLSVVCVELGIDCASGDYAAFPGHSWNLAGSENIPTLKLGTRFPEWASKTCNHLPASSC